MIQYCSSDLRCLAVLISRCEAQIKIIIFFCHLLDLNVPKSFVLNMVDTFSRPIRLVFLNSHHCCHIAVFGGDY